METDKHGIPVYPDVARIDQYGEVAVKRFNPNVGWNRTEHLLAIAHYILQGKKILEAANKAIEAGKETETFLLSKLCHKAAISFTEAGNAEEQYRTKYGAYGMGAKTK